MVARREEPTGQAFITVDRAGENSIVILAGANGKVTPAPGGVPQGAACPGGLPGYAAGNPLDAVLAGAKLAAALGKVVVLDPAPAPGPLPRELLSLCGLIKPNETELHLLTGLPTATPQECQAAACPAAGPGCKGGAGVLGQPGRHGRNGGGLPPGACLSCQGGGLHLCRRLLYGGVSGQMAGGLLPARSWRTPFAMPMPPRL